MKTQRFVILLLWLVLYGGNTFAQIDTCLQNQVLSFNPDRIGFAVPQVLDTQKLKPIEAVFTAASVIPLFDSNGITSIQFFEGAQLKGLYISDSAINSSNFYQTDDNLYAIQLNPGGYVVLNPELRCSGAWNPPDLGIHSFFFKNGLIHWIEWNRDM
jgi:hypothetical protein